MTVGKNHEGDGMKRWGQRAPDGHWHCDMCDRFHPFGLSHGQAVYRDKPVIVQPEPAWSPYP